MPVQKNRVQTYLHTKDHKRLKDLALLHERTLINTLSMLIRKEIRKQQRRLSKGHITY